MSTRALATRGGLLSSSMKDATTGPNTRRHEVVIDLTTCEEDNTTFTATSRRQTERAPRKRRKTEETVDTACSSPVGDDGDDFDDEIQVVDAPSPKMTAVQTSTHQTCEEDIQLVGTLNEQRLPHMRQHCTEHPFREAVVSGSRKFCSECYCYVCDIRASDCQRWDDHFGATDQGSGSLMWKNMRENHKREKKADTGTAEPHPRRVSCLDDPLTGLGVDRHREATRRSHEANEPRIASRTSSTASNASTRTNSPAASGTTSTTSARTASTTEQNPHGVVRPSERARDDFSSISNRLEAAASRSAASSSAFVRTFNNTTTASRPTEVAPLRRSNVASEADQAETRLAPSPRTTVAAASSNARSAAACRGPSASTSHPPAVTPQQLIFQLCFREQTFLQQQKFALMRHAQLQLPNGDALLAFQRQQFRQLQRSHQEILLRHARQFGENASP